jgi:8-oxo-dGTP diphosphatase
MLSVKQGFRIAARGLVIQNNKLLLVSDDGKYWYLPGGRLEGAESLKECVEREVYEETGLVVKVDNLLHVQECLDLADELHKINFYFQTTIVCGEGDLLEGWSDAGGTVQYRRYFSLTEIQQQQNILPRFLAEGDWCNEKQKIAYFYQGIVKMRGFEMVAID